MKANESWGGSENTRDGFKQNYFFAVVLPSASTQTPTQLLPSDPRRFLQTEPVFSAAFRTLYP